MQMHRESGPVHFIIFITTKIRTKIKTHAVKTILSFLDVHTHSHTHWLHGWRAGPVVGTCACAGNEVTVRGRGNEDEVKVIGRGMRMT